MRPDEIDVWRVDLDGEDPGGSLYASLTPDEREQVRRCRSPVDGRRFGLGRASLRVILSRYTGESARGLRLSREPRGRMILDASSPLSFSVAHAGPVGLVAIGLARSIGVDLEPLSAAPQIADVADHYLPGARVATARSAPAGQQNEQWLRLWTEVEAYAKLDGRGLIDAKSTEILLEAREHSVQFRPTPDHVATLVYTGRAARVTYLLFSPSAGEEPVRVERSPG